MSSSVYGFVISLLNMRRSINKKNENQIESILPEGIKQDVKFSMERVIADNISVGILNIGLTLFDDEFIPIKYTNQGLKYKTQYYNLLQETNEINNLIYKFRGFSKNDNLILELQKINNDVKYKLHDNNSLYETGTINPIIKKTYKKIDNNSHELDHIFDLFNS